MSCEQRTLSEVVGQPLITIDRDVSACEALRLVRSKQIHHLPVTHGARLVGLVCTCDLEGAPTTAAVGQWMSHPAVTLEASATLAEAVQVMNARKIGSVIVMSGGEARGIVTRGDLLNADPGIADILVSSRCELCGLTRHLSTNEGGHTFCKYCQLSTSQSSAAAPVEAREELIAAAPEYSFRTHPLVSLIREHQLIGPLAEALEAYSACVQLDRSVYDREDLEHFARVFHELGDCVHHEKEEGILLPFLARQGFDWNSGTLAEVRGEHQQERYLVEVLSHAAARKQSWTREDCRRIAAAGAALAQFQRGHLLKENDSLYPGVTERLGRAALERLQAELERFDARVERYIPYAELTALGQRLIQRYHAAGSPRTSESNAWDLVC